MPASRTRLLSLLVAATLTACAAPPAAPIESTAPATEAPVSDAEATARALAETSMPQETLGTPPGYPTEVIEAVVTDPLVVALLAGLEQHGLAVALSDASRNDMLRDAPGQGYRLGEGWLHLHVYPAVAEAEAAAARIPGEMEASIADWVAAPHFFQCDQLIAAYFGADRAALDALSALCAPPFYSTELPQDAGDAPVTDYSTVDSPDRGRQPVDPLLRPADLHGHEYVALGMDGEIYLVDWTTGVQTQLTSDGGFKGEAVLSDRYVAWTANVEPDSQGQPLAHIYVLDRGTGDVRIITAEPAPRMQLVLEGDRLAWADKRNELDGHYTAYDIYAYDLTTSTEIAVAVAPGAQHQPSLSGSLLVWADNRDSPTRDGDLAGCGNCPANRFDLYLYDFAAQTTRVLVSGQALRTGPALDGQRVAWIEFAYVEAPTSQGAVAGAGDVYWMDLATETVQRVTNTPQSESWPGLSSDRLLWTVRQDCDVLTGPVGATPEPPQTGVYTLDLAGGAVQRLTDYVEPRAFLSGDSVLIMEGCMAGWEVYVVAVE